MFCATPSRFAATAAHRRRRCKLLPTQTLRAWFRSCRWLPHRCGCCMKCQKGGGEHGALSRRPSCIPYLRSSSFCPLSFCHHLLSPPLPPGEGRGEGGGASESLTAFGAYLCVLDRGFFLRVVFIARFACFPPFPAYFRPVPEGRTRAGRRQDEGRTKAGRRQDEGRMKAGWGQEFPPPGGLCTSGSRSTGIDRRVGLNHEIHEPHESKKGEATDETRMEHGGYPCSICVRSVALLPSSLPTTPLTLRERVGVKAFILLVAIHHSLATSHSCFPDCTLFLTLVNTHCYSCRRVRRNPLRRNGLGRLKTVCAGRRRTMAAKPIRRRKSLQAQDLEKPAPIRLPSVHDRSAEIISALCRRRWLN